MTKSSINAVHGSSPSVNGNHSEINSSQKEGLYRRLHDEKVEPRSSLSFYEPAEPVNVRLQNPLHTAQPARDTVSLHPTAGAASSVTVLKDTISAKDLAGIGDQFSVKKRCE